MRYPYAPKRLREAAQVLEGTGDLRQGLYGAFQRLHTLLPGHFPEGELQGRFANLHARFTNAHARDQTEDSVIAVLERMAPEAIRTLASDLQTFAEQVERDAQDRQA